VFLVVLFARADARTTGPEDSERPLIRTPSAATFPPKSEKGV
jgi:hypothetical protein